ncbi:TPA: radical SAM protein, partial [Candidatus Poribacteria bacterium]|nr:radical SAM protein [Candidatus Poribacteria bacterium]
MERKKMKVLLVQPPSPPNIIGEGIAFLAEPLALEIVAAGIPHHDVKILDMRIESNLKQELESFQPDVVGTTSYTPGVYMAQKVLQNVKAYNPEILTVIGGHHATVMPEDFNQEYIDAIVIGEGEITFKELVDAYENKTNFSKVDGIAFPQNGNLTFTQPRAPIENLDEISLPARHLVENYRKEYFRQTWRPVASLMTSRGCPYRCNFCALWKVAGGKYWTRSPESVVNEIANIKERYIELTDDNALHDVQRAERIYELIKERSIQKIYKLFARSNTVVKRPGIIEKWKEIGMELILIGFESFRDSELKDMNKATTVAINNEAIRILHENDVEIASYFIVNPNYEKEDFDVLAEYVEKMNLTQPGFTVLTPLPGTDLFYEKSDELITHNYELFDLI